MRNSIVFLLLSSCVLHAQGRAVVSVNEWQHEGQHERELDEALSAHRLRATTNREVDSRDQLNRPSFFIAEDTWI